MKKEDFIYMYILNGGEAEYGGKGMDNLTTQETAARKWQETKDYLQESDYKERMDDLAQRVWDFTIKDDFNLTLE